MSTDVLCAALTAIVGGKFRVESTTRDGKPLDVVTLHEKSLQSAKLNTFNATDAARAKHQKAPDIAYVKTLTGKTIEVLFFMRETVKDIKLAIQDYEGIPVSQQRLVFASQQLDDDRTFWSYGVRHKSTVILILRIPARETYSLDSSLLAPKYDYDFTNIDDAANGRTFRRGGRPYIRPCGWRRFALNVSGRYDSGDDTWLAQDGRAGEWAVSYHGTSCVAARGIAERGYDLTKGKRFAYGRGIYSTPDILVAEQYATRFSVGDEDFLILMQNRIDPSQTTDVTSVTCKYPYLLCPPEAIRPYGILIKNVTSMARKGKRAAPT